MLRLSVHVQISMNSFQHEPKPHHQALSSDSSLHKNLDDLLWIQRPRFVHCFCYYLSGVMNLMLMVLMFSIDPDQLVSILTWLPSSPAIGPGSSCHCCLWHLVDWFVLHVVIFAWCTAVTVCIKLVVISCLVHSSLFFSLHHPPQWLFNHCNMIFLFHFLLSSF